MKVVYIVHSVVVVGNRSIYLSGGVSLLPGFQERLEAELKKLVPVSVPVEVRT